MIRAKIYAVFAAIGLALLAALKVVTMQRDAAKEDARRAKKHLDERKKIVAAQKDIKVARKKAEAKAVEDIRNGKMPSNISNRNNF